MPSNEVKSDIISYRKNRSKITIFLSKKVNQKRICVCMVHLMTFFTSLWLHISDILGFFFFSKNGLINFLLISMGNEDPACTHVWLYVPFVMEQIKDVIQDTTILITIMS